MNQDEEIQEYIRQHRSTYTREGITRSLVASGYAVEDIDRNWIALEPETKAALARPRTTEPTRISTLVVVWLLGGGGVYFYFLLSSSVAGYTYLRRYNSRINLLLIVTEIASLIVGIYWLRRGWRPSQVFALLVALNFVWFFIILGTCLFGYNGYPG